ncbi:MAG: c-type cytochrome biogenesis protein CcsB [Austwickia sp.]|nr:c-type cytochrome biogenesis protein CcsB [Austwickia sp.]MBK8436656.1 c-type cytochrome biogenesis protein CcsB [Austwickia sp.]
MTNLMLAGYANLTLYIAMAVLALAMIAFSAYVALSVSGQTRPHEQPARRREPVVVGARAAHGVDDWTDSEGHASSIGDLARPVSKRAGTAGGYAMSLSWLGTFFLVASVILRGASVSRPPLGNMFEFATFGAMLVMLVYLGLSMRWPLRWLGLFVVVPVLLTLGLAMTVWYTAASELLPSLKSVWLVIHVTVATLSVALFTLACSVLILHLLRTAADARMSDEVGTRSAWQGFLATLPSARTLDRISYGLHVVAFPLYTFTLIAGAIWAQQAWGSYWNWDPKEVWTFIVWVIYAAYLHARATSGWSVRTANVLALVGYAAIIVNFTVVNIYFPGQHSYSGLS